MESLEKIKKIAVELTPVERIRLVETLLYSLDKPDSEIEKSWITESEARYDAFKRGELESNNWEEIRKKYEK